jgi:hypothetical protein
MTTPALTVKRCADCPFFERLPLASAIEALAGSDAVLAMIGSCRYDRERNELIVIRLGLQGPERDAMMEAAKRRLPVRDRNTIPEKCPLRSGDVVVTLGS